MTGSRSTNRFRILGSLLTILGLVAAILLSLGQLGAYHWRADLFAHFTPHYIVGLLAAAGGLAALRAYRSCAVFTAFAAAGMILVAPYLNRGSSPISETSSPFSVLLYNVNLGNTNYAAVIEYIRERDCDLVVIVEATPRWVDALGRLDDIYPHAFALPRPDAFGLAVYSRTPLSDWQATAPGTVDLPTLHGTVTIDDTPIRVFAAHPLPPTDKQNSRWRNEQIRELAERIGDTRGIKLLFGDLNVTPWSPNYRALENRAGVVNCARGHGIVPTWPTTRSPIKIPIDHCLASRDVTVFGVTTGPDLGSDHYPIEFRLGIRAQSDADSFDTARRSSNAGHDSVD